MWEQIQKIIQMIEPLLIVVIPTCFGIYLKVKNKVHEKSVKIEKEFEVKNREKFIDWEHSESMVIIDKIKAICNYYRDIGHMDLVNYIQFENGTMATSKLCNMFLSCLAEDNRYGKIPKFISTLQRIPYSRLSTWTNNVINSEKGIYRVNNREKDFDEDYSEFIIGSENAKSFISGAVKDQNGVLIGICSFFFAEEDCCGTECENIERCITTLQQFITSVETIFLEYNIARENKKKELNIK